jgi:diketogulonate reductase-like aldo/keto reductase
MTDSKLYPESVPQAVPAAVGLPALGLGTWKLPKPQAPAVIREAVRLGYRHFDCACDYGNEAEVGAGLASALREGLCRRDDL